MWPETWVNGWDLVPTVDGIPSKSLNFSSRKSPQWMKIALQCFTLDSRNKFSFCTKIALLTVKNERNSKNSVFVLKLHFLTFFDRKKNVRKIQKFSFRARKLKLHSFFQFQVQVHYQDTLWGSLILVRFFVISMEFRSETHWIFTGNEGENGILGRNQTFFWGVNSL